LLFGAIASLRADIIGGQVAIMPKSIAYENYLTQFQRKRSFTLRLNHAQAVDELHPAQTISSSAEFGG